MPGRPDGPSAGPADGEPQSGDGGSERGEGGGRPPLLARLVAPLGVEWGPQAPADWPAGVSAGIVLATPLLVGTASGHPEDGASLTLPALLAVMPLPPAAGLLERLRHIAVRTLTITLAGVYSALIGGVVWALVPAIMVSAVLGAVLPRVGNTAPLAVLLVGISGPAQAFGGPGVPQLVGSVWGALFLLPRWGRGRRAAPAAPYRPPARTHEDWRHAARLALLLGAAVAVMAAIHRLSGEGHWLVTGILLALRPTAQATQARARQRVVGNTLGGIAAALVLLTHPDPWAVTGIVAVAGTLAYALRPANYLYWCLAFPLLLLVLTDFGRTTHWYAAAVRAALVLAGAAISVLAARWLWPPPPREGHERKR